MRLLLIALYKYPYLLTYCAHNMTASMHQQVLAKGYSRLLVSRMCKLAATPVKCGVIII